MRPDANKTFHPEALLVTTHHLLYNTSTLLTFPADVDPKSAVVTHDLATNLVDIKLKCTPTPAPNQTAHALLPSHHPTLGDIKPPLSAQDLTTLRSINCIACSERLVNANTNLASVTDPTSSQPPFEHIKNLPSEHWLELIDCWLCHEDQDQQQHKNKLKDIDAQKGTLLVGNTYFLLHPDDLPLDSVRRDDNAPDIDVHPRYPASSLFRTPHPGFSPHFARPIMDHKKAGIPSHAILGRYYRSYIDSISGQGHHDPSRTLQTARTRSRTRRAGYYRADISRKEPAVDAWDFQEVDTRHMCQMLGAFGRGNDDRTSVEADPTLLAVKLTKYMVSVALSSPSNLATPLVTEIHPFTTFIALDFIEAAKAHANYRFVIEGRTSRRAHVLDDRSSRTIIWLFNWDTKIVYNNGFRDLGVAKAAEEGERKKTADRTAEHLVYPDATCARLVDALRESTSYLPEVVRAFQGFRVGFLEKGV
ncbi:HECT-like ubiquitin-conjugating enzyme-binding-domain-containing protein [Jimgerdemannia flammicorona]|uniref:HECT-like ubiquitin-conjugating enzyme-binding-domain-containing protein n=1 Tax=Jimgerdemannia flammicorona TaxID=994334 RepID=A0A433Q9R8_9FUNG|nr:HECT-like ubiquitin-conjugating enzyme-binding-domain-containing protein [Jimgerdemannia flammicorona]